MSTHLINWEDLRRQYPVGENINAVVTTVFPAGARVRLPDGVSAHLASRDLSWDDTELDATKRLHIGQTIRIQIREVDAVRSRIKVSLRHAERDPWPRYHQNYHNGKIARGRVIDFDAGAVVIELTDGLTGVIEPQQLTPWDTSAGELLELGDFVETVVLGRNDRLREVNLSLVERWRQIDTETKGSKAQIPSQQLDEYQPEPLIELQIGPSNISNIGNTLVIEHQDDERALLIDILHDFGLPHVIGAASEEEAHRLLVNLDCRWVFVDLDFPGNGPHGGLIIAESLHINFPDLRFVLVTGNELPQLTDISERLRKTFITLLRKPVRYDRVAKLLSRLGEPGSGWDNLHPASSQDDDDQRSLDLRMVANFRQATGVLTSTEGILQWLTRTVHADAGAIIAWDPNHGKAQLIAHVGLEIHNFEECRPHLAQSPVTDLAREPNHRVYTDHAATGPYGEFYYMRQILGRRPSSSEWALTSCIGELIPAALPIFYTLFIMSQQSAHFSRDHRAIVMAGAIALAASFREHEYFDYVEAQQRFAAIGAAFGAISHEMKGRMSTLAAADSVSTSWRQLKTNPNLLHDSSFTADMDARIERIVSARGAMDSIVRLILGRLRTDTYQHINLYGVTQNAMAACCETARRQRIRLHSLIPPHELIFSHAVEIEQIVVNIIINAIETISRSRRHYGTIQMRMDTHDDDRGRAILLISDTGPGMHATLFSPRDDGDELIFRPRFTTKPEGTGMGLYLSRALLARMGGDIYVNSSYILIGTTFAIHLPREDWR